MVFSEIVSQISFPWGPIDLKLALGNAVLEPVEAHVNGFGSILFDGVVEDTIGRAVVSSDRCRGLFVSQYNEGDAVWDCCTGIQVACPISDSAAEARTFFMMVVMALKEALKNFPSLLPRKKKPPARLRARRATR